MKYAVVVGVFALVACAADVAPAPTEAPTVDPSERAIAIWALEHGAPTAQCAEHARGATFIVEAPEALAETCERTVGLVDACMYRYDVTGGDIAIADNEHGRSHDTHVHELLHVMLWCAGLGAADSDTHADAVWSHVEQTWSLLVRRDQG